METYRHWTVSIEQVAPLLWVATAKYRGAHDLSATGTDEDDCREAIQARIDFYWQGQFGELGITP